MDSDRESQCVFRFCQFSDKIRFCIGRVGFPGRSFVTICGLRSVKHACIFIRMLLPLAAQNKVSVEHYIHQGKQWLFSEFGDLDGKIYLNSIGCELFLREIYDKVGFPCEKKPERKRTCIESISPEPGGTQHESIGILWQSRYSA